MLSKFDQHKILAIKCGGKQGFIDYMSFACRSPKERYTDNEVVKLLGSLMTMLARVGAWNVVEYFFEKISNKVCGTDYSAIGCCSNIDVRALIELQITAIESVRIRNDKGPVNGFTEESLKSFEEDVEPILWPTESNQTKKVLKDIKEFLNNDNLAIFEDGEAYEPCLDELNEGLCLLEKALEKNEQYKDALELASFKLTEKGQDTAEVMANLLEAVAK